METDAITYRLAPAPKFAGLQAWDCAECGREELGKPVFLDGGAGVIAVGTGCAAKLLGYRRPEQVRREADAVQAAADRAEATRASIAANKAAALAAFNAGNDEDPFLLGARGDFHRLGGSATLGKFSEWLARVAATGQLTAA